MAEKSSGLFKAIATFHDQQGHPLSGPEWKVKLYDDDPLFDDYLGQSSLNQQGEAHLLIAVADIYSVDSLQERHPDLYFVLERDGTKVFQSEIFKDVSFEGLDSVTGEPNQLTRGFGPFSIDG